MMNEASTDAEIDRIIRRIRLEVARRNAGQSDSPVSLRATRKPKQANGQSPVGPAVLTEHGDDNERPAALSVQLLNVGFRPNETSFRPNLEGRYRLEDLLRYDDREFVHAAYLAILRRPADKKGFDDYLRLLRAGRQKAAILENLRASPEGRRAGSTVTGLRLHNAIANIACLPFLGWLIRLVVAIFELPNARLRERALEGRIHVLLERDRDRLLESVDVINRALRDLKDAVNDVVAETTSGEHDRAHGTIKSPAGKIQHATDDK
jgi:hypothetical protein